MRIGNILDHFLNHPNNQKLNKPVLEKMGYIAAMKLTQRLRQSNIKITTTSNAINTNLEVPPVTVKEIYRKKYDAYSTRTTIATKNRTRNKTIGKN